MESKLNRRQADRIVKAKYGPTAAAVRQPGQKDRNQRFGVAMIEPSGLGDKSYLVVLGYGASYEEALDMASKSEAGVMAANRWATIQEHWAEFGKDPQKYLEQFRRDFEKFGKEQNQNND